jgi:hypothetical protein
MTVRVTLIVLLVLGGVLVAQVDAETFTFQPTNGVWHDEDNWEDSEEQPGIPGSADTAVIPGFKFCTIDADEAEAQIVNVESFGILYITQDAKLTIYDGTAEDCTISGLVKFIAREDGEDPGELHCYNNVTVAGNGSINATDGVKGRITSRVVESVPTTLTLGGDSIINGYIDLEAKLINNGIVEVSGLNNVMRLMTHPKVGTSGGFWIVRALGKMEVDAEVSGSAHWWLDQEASGYGELQIDAACTNLEGIMRIGGGTMNVNASFCIEDYLQYFGGTINVTDNQAGVTAKFGGVCP